MVPCNPKILFKIILFYWNWRSGLTTVRFRGNRRLKVRLILRRYTTSQIRALCTAVRNGDINDRAANSSRQTVSDVYIGWSHVTVICAHNTNSMLRGNTAYCVQLSGQELLRYSNKFESVGLRKCPYYQDLTKKVLLLSQQKHFAEIAHRSWREKSWHRYGTKKLRHCHPMYSAQLSRRHANRHRPP